MTATQPIEAYAAIEPGDSYYLQSSPSAEPAPLARIGLLDLVLGLYILTMTALEITPYYKVSTYIAYSLPLFLLIAVIGGRWILAPEAILLALFLGWLWVCTNMSEYKLLSMIRLTYVSKVYAVCIIIALRGCSLPRTRFFLSCIVIGTIITWSYGFRTGIDTALAGGERLTGIQEAGAASNSYAGTLSAGIIATIVLHASVRKKWITYASIIFIAVSLTLIAATGSRTSAITALAAIIIYIFILYGARARSRPFALLLAIAFIIAIPLLLIWLFPQSPLIARTLGTDLTGRDSSLGRQQLAWIAFGVIAEHPLFGIGPGTFPMYSDGHSSHNDLLNLFLGGGIPGAALFLAFIFLPLWRARHLSKRLRSSGLWNRLLAASTAVIIAYFSRMVFSHNVLPGKLPMIMITIIASFTLVTHKTMPTGSLAYYPPSSD